MDGHDWDEGSKCCSNLVDHFDPIIDHLYHRDVSMIADSTAPLSQFETFKKRIGWTFTWVSSFGTDFNRDFHIIFHARENCRRDRLLQLPEHTIPGHRSPGLQCAPQGWEGEKFHTYSFYGRGLDMFPTTYHHLDLVPKGRGEDGLSSTMDWLRLHDTYDV